jgi:hypothetical protein
MPVKNIVRAKKQCGTSLRRPLVLLYLFGTVAF